MKSKSNTSQSASKAGSGPTIRFVGIIRNNIKEPFLSAGRDGINMQGELNEVKREIRKQQGYVSDIVIVTDLDAVDGSPVIDIKPYVRDIYCLEDSTTPEWMRKLIEEIQEKEEE